MNKGGRPPTDLVFRLRSALWYHAVREIAIIYGYPSDYKLSEAFGTGIFIPGDGRHRVFEIIRKERIEVNPHLLIRIEKRFPGTKEIYKSVLWDFLAKPYVDIRKIRYFQYISARALLKKTEVPLYSRIVKQDILELNRDLNPREFGYFSNYFFKHLHEINSKFSRSHSSFLEQLTNSINLAVFWGSLYREAHIAGNLRIAGYVREQIYESFDYVAEFGVISDTFIDINKLRKKDIEALRRRETLLKERRVLIETLNDIIGESLFGSLIDPKTVPDPSLQPMASRNVSTPYRNYVLKQFMEYNHDFHWKR